MEVVVGNGRFEEGEGETALSSCWWSIEAVGELLLELGAVDDGRTRELNVPDSCRGGVVGADTDVLAPDDGANVYERMWTSERKKKLCEMSAQGEEH